MKVFGKFVLAGLLLTAWSSSVEADARLRIVGPKSVYAKVGLKSGDVIVTIDGKEVQSASEASQTLYQKSGDGKRHHMEVRRSGKIIDINF